MEFDQNKVLYQVWDNPFKFGAAQIKATFLFKSNLSGEYLSIKDLAFRLS